MEKSCTNCGKLYFARWRNEPVELCAACKPAAVVCSVCAAMMRWPHDPDQLPLFRHGQLPIPVILPPVNDTERYWSLRARASRKTLTRYPYQ